MQWLQMKEERRDTRKSERLGKECQHKRDKALTCDVISFSSCVLVECSMSEIRGDGLKNLAFFALCMLLGVLLYVYLFHVHFTLHLF